MVAHCLHYNLEIYVCIPAGCQKMLESIKNKIRAKKNVPPFKWQIIGHGVLYIYIPVSFDDFSNANDDNDKC